MAETLLSPSNIILFGKVVEDLQVVQRKKSDDHSPFVTARTGGGRDLENQLSEKLAPCFARIYGFSYEGTYHDLPQPPLFLVHGEGEPVTPNSPGKDGAERTANDSRAPSDPTLSGVSAAEFQFSDGLRAWSYDKCDHTIRMDVDSGEFQDVLLSPYLGGGGPAVSGAMVSGAMVRGKGPRVSGNRVSGAMLRGGGAGD